MDKDVANVVELGVAARVGVPEDKAAESQQTGAQSYHLRKKNK